MNAGVGSAARKAFNRAPPRILDRHILLLFLAGVALTLGWRAIDLASLSEVSASALKYRSGMGAGELLVLSVLFWLAWGAGSDNLLPRSNLAALTLASVTFALPYRLAAAAPILVVGGQLMLARNDRLRSIGQLLFALAFYEWIGPGLFHLLSPLALRIEALGVQAILSPLGGFNRYDLIISAPNGHAIFIEEGCSAFRNLSLAALIWISLLKLERLSMRPGDGLVLAAMAMTTIALNLVRIALMAQSDAMFLYWHDGPGATIASAVMLGAAIMVFFARGEMREAGG